MHDPEGYYPRRFMNDFDTFWQALEAYGSASPGRVEGRFVFAAEDFAVREDGRDLLGEIHKARRIPFMYGMMLSVLLDQLLYTHFRTQYSAWNVSLFQQGHRLGLLSHPKMAPGDDGGESHPMHGMERPWDIFRAENLKSRDWKLSDIVTGFRPYADRMVGEWNRLVNRGSLPGLEWPAIVQALSRDPHISTSPFGRAIIEAAAAREWTRTHAA